MLATLSPEADFPGTSFFLKKRGYAPARRLIAAGVPLTLATDCNPGSSHTESLPMIFWPTAASTARVALEDASGKALARATSGFALGTFCSAFVQVPPTQGPGPIRLTVDFDSGPLAGRLSTVKEFVVRRD